MLIDKNSFVTISYLIRMGEEEYYPQSGQPEEISFCMGWGVMPMGLEEALLGMEENEHKVVRLAAAEAYGETDQELTHGGAPGGFRPRGGAEPGPGI